jgi:hypothetical protein
LAEVNLKECKIYYLRTPLSAFAHTFPFMMLSTEAMNQYNTMTDTITPE